MLKIKEFHSELNAFEVYNLFKNQKNSILLDSSKEDKNLSKYSFIGINEFIKRLDYLTYTNYNKEDDFIGKVYKVKYDDNKNRVTYIKALQGSIKV